MSWTCFFGGITWPNQISCCCCFSLLACFPNQCTFVLVFWEMRFFCIVLLGSLQFPNICKLLIASFMIKNRMVLVARTILIIINISERVNRNIILFLSWIQLPTFSLQKNLAKVTSVNFDNLDSEATVSKWIIHRHNSSSSSMLFLSKWAINCVYFADNRNTTRIYAHACSMNYTNTKIGFVYHLLNCMA